MRIAQSNKTSPVWAREWWRTVEIVLEVHNLGWRVVASMWIGLVLRDCLDVGSTLRLRFFGFIDGVKVEAQYFFGEHENGGLRSR